MLCRYILCMYCEWTKLWHKRCAEIQEMACFFFQLLDNVTASIGYTLKKAMKKHVCLCYAISLPTYLHNVDVVG